MNIAFASDAADIPRLVLYGVKGKKRIEIPFDEDRRVGNVYYMGLSGLDGEECTYNFISGGREVTDPYAKRLSGDEVWGRHNPKAVWKKEGFDWGNDRSPGIETEDMIIYLLHVRGFTMHRSSGVAHRGTFEGIIEKIPYLKSLGINTLELMPVYDFNEVMEQKAENTGEAAKPVNSGSRGNRRLNYWGFTKGAYMTPKNAYSACGNGVRSFKALVKALHEASLEVLIQFYFPPGLNPDYVIDVLREWVASYHVDGMRILGEELPLRQILSDPYLSSTKLVFKSGAGEALAEAMADTNDRRRRVLLLNEGFLPDNRQFLKSDSDMLKRFVNHQFLCRPLYAVLNYMDSYDAMTLMDMVSYDRKHNEENGENNTDGTDYNYSWNCGVEGPSRRRAVRLLRLKQIRNAFTYLLLAQGVPEFVAGDEFMHSRKGNNNAYCQDNMTNWLNWSELEKNREMKDFVSALIAMRKNHRMFHDGAPKKLMDYKSCGCPDVSLHGDQAWLAKLDNYNRHVGIMYCGEYEQQETKEAKDYYVAYNMHWQHHKFALPKPLKGRSWRIIMMTGKGFLEEPELYPGNEIVVNSRSITLLEAVNEGGR
ncbi:MAG: hypothetical protein K5985_01590 [Lachnospiraceae bacterium]|nr:hypothetical protein [Lachnospiraceae bacterium]